MEGGPGLEVHLYLLKQNKAQVISDGDPPTAGHQLHMGTAGLFYSSPPPRSNLNPIYIIIYLMFLKYVLFFISNATGWIEAKSLVYRK